MRRDRERNTGNSVEKCRIQRNLGRGRRMVWSKSRRRKMDRVRRVGREDSRHGGCDEERGVNSSDGDQRRRVISGDVVWRGSGVQVDRGGSGRDVMEMMVDLVADRGERLDHHRPGLVMLWRHGRNSRPHPRQVMDDPGSNRIKVRLGVVVGDMGRLGPDALAYCERVQVSRRQGPGAVGRGGRSVGRGGGNPGCRVIGGGGRGRSVTRGGGRRGIHRLRRGIHWLRRGIHWDRIFISRF